MRAWLLSEGKLHRQRRRQYNIRCGDLYCLDRVHIDVWSKKLHKDYILKQLKTAGYYLSTVPVWHYAMTKARTEKIEAVQKRAIHYYGRPME